MQYITRVATGLYGVFREQEKLEQALDPDDVGELQESAVGEGYAKEREVKWSAEVEVYNKDPEEKAPTYELILERCRLSIVKTADGYGLEVETVDRSKSLLWAPLGDGLTMSYHEASASAQFTSIDDQGEAIEWSAVMHDDPQDGTYGDDLREAPAVLQSFIQEYSSYAYAAYVQDVPEETKVDLEEADIWSPAASPCSLIGEEDLKDMADERSDSMGSSMNYYDYYEDDEDPNRNYEEDFKTPSKKLHRKTMDRNVMFADNEQSHRLLVLREAQEDKSAHIGVCAYGDQGFDPMNTTEIRDLSWGNKQISAQELISHPNDLTKALLLDRDAPQGGVYLTDLAAEKVVSTYNPSKGLDLNINHILPTAEDEPNLVTGLTGNCVFAMDLRQNATNCGVEKGDGETKTVMDWSLSLPSTKTLACHATSKDGKLAIGSRNGDIRLYSGTPGVQKRSGRGVHPKTAKTLLNGHGDPIRFLDITQKGDWLLATLDKYLVLLKIGFVDDDDKEQNGFDKAMGKFKPKPIILKIDLKKMGGLGGVETCFGKARFECTVEGGREDRIVATFGSSLVSWHLDAIRRNADLGRSLVGTKTEARPLVDITASSTGVVKYITESNIGMATPKVTRTPGKSAGKYTLSYNRH